MRFATHLATLVLTASSALAAENFIHNKCDFDIWFTSVGTGDPDPPTLLKSGYYVTENQYFSGTGTALKFTRDQDGIWTNKPVLHFSYTYAAGSSIYYGISTDHGFDFWGKKVVLEGDKKDAPGIVWDGMPGEVKTVAWLHGELDLHFTVCA